ncbi:MAG: type II toxin-antitoxin system VapC family toxin [Proteobacteria bacterium]|nr:type II toxin-antitoxin system VapC family toxin [Pseudomonadota bacterium]
MKASLIFDSSALLKLFQKEPGFEKVIRILRIAQEENLRKLLNIINLGEIIYITKKHFGNEKKLGILGNIHRLGFEILPAKDDLVFRAAEIKGDYPISYADAFTMASALEHSAAVITSDPDFEKVSSFIEIIWV